MEQLAEKVFLKDEHDKLAEFFQKTWEEPSATEKYEYRVYLSQICLNLNELFFARSIGEMDEAKPPHYEQVSEDELKEALIEIVNMMVKKRNEFQAKYNELLANEPAGGLARWNFAAFLQSYFAENITQHM